MDKKKRDIFLILSDQHSQNLTGFADQRVDTPWLEEIASRGQQFNNCYCNAPLCVPSRMSFLTGQMPCDLEIFNNNTSLKVDMPTIAHEFGAMGYETVLIGRMHFKGDDQKHGFDHHLCGDITSQYWGTGGKERKDFGLYAGTSNRKYCLEQIGGGYSPVMAYDEMVLGKTREFLENWYSGEDERPPLFLVTGFYSPHFPFVCKRELYQKYKERFSMEEQEKQKDLVALPVYKEYCQDSTLEQMRNCRAAYCGMVEQLDKYVGELYTCFCEKAAAKDHAFIYTSDHGEQLGKRDIYGKQTLYEDAVKVPLVVTGSKIKPAVIHEPVDLLDVSRTLLALADADEKFPWHQGRVLPSLFDENKEKETENSQAYWVRIQQMLEKNNRPILAQAAVNGHYKVLYIEDNWYVYDLQKDPEETENLLVTEKELAEELINRAKRQGGFVEEKQVEWLEKREGERKLVQNRLTRWGKAKKPDEWGTVKIPQGSLQPPIE